MSIKELIAKAAEFVANSWNDDTGGREKLQQAAEDLYAWVEENDDKLVSNLPGIIGYILPSVVDNPTIDATQKAACIFAVESAYQLVSGMSDLYEDAVDNIEAIIERVKDHLGIA